MKFDISKYHDLLAGRLDPQATTSGVPDYSYSPLNRSGELYTPILDRHYLQSGSQPQWPHGKRFAVCLTHDVDAVAEFDPVQNIASMFHILKTRSGRKNSDMIKWLVIHKMRAFRGLFGKEQSLCRFEDWLALEEKYGARSTFFFAPGHVLRKHPSDCQYSYGQTIRYGGKKISVAKLMNEISTSGWEVGLHPSWHAHGDIMEMRHQKDQIEQVLGNPIVSVRQHFLKYDPQLTPRIHEEAGFKYDSTLGFNDNIGFKRGTSYPFHLYDLTAEKQLGVLEIPLTLQDGALLLPDKGLRLNVNESLQYIELMVERVRSVGGVLNLSWHPHTRHYPGFWELYEKTLDVVSQADPYFGTVAQIGEHWKAHVGIDLLDHTKTLQKSEKDQGVTPS